MFLCGRVSWKIDKNLCNNVSILQDTFTHCVIDVQLFLELKVYIGLMSGESSATSNQTGFCTEEL